ncbi:MAG: choice-of-anchor J domain-containing protein [Bacteroidales bacterium]|nr:choice-of-anchor J domain-containing protein [Bacteroidales bacterium]
MKHIFKLFLSLFIVSGLMMNSCVKDDFDQPEIPNQCDQKTDFTPNITVAGIHAIFDSLSVIDGSTVRQFPDTNFVLEAKVVSSDETGNFYKVMYLEDATGAVCLSIEGSDLYIDYPLGQTVHLNLSGLTVEFDSWVGINEIGMGTYLEAGVIKGIGRIPVTHLPVMLQNHSCPSKLTPTVLTAMPYDDSNVGRLVTFEELQVIAADTAKTYADAVSDPPQSVSINLEDCSGNQIILRNSGYASFAGFAVPKGKGSITGVLTKYGSDYQILIRDTSDVQFTGTRCGAGGGGGTGEGTGTFDDPYNIEAGISNQGGTGVWVQGFIVGTVINDGTNPIYSDLEAPFTVNTNVYIAASATETDTTKMLSVKLPSGAVRTATNLLDHVDLLGLEIKYHGDLGAYNLIPGMLNTSGYWLIEANTGIDPNYVAPGTFWTEDFASSLGQFTGVSVVGAQVWAQGTYSGTTYAKMSGYSSGNQDNEDWLVSSTIDLSGKTNVKLVVNQCAKFFGGTESWNDLKIFVTTNYTGDVSTTTWDAITYNTHNDGTSYDFTDTEDLDLSAYDGQSVTIAFKYVSTTGGSATWEVSKVSLKN